MKIFTTRKPFSLTDEQVMKEALKTVTEYGNEHPGDSFDINKCVEETLKAVKKVYSRDRGYFAGMTQFFNKDDSQEYEAIYSRVEAQLREAAWHKTMEYLKGRRVMEINAASAEPVMSHEMRRRGQTFFCEIQKQRIKTTVRLEGRKALTFIVTYRQILEGKLPGILDEVFSAVEVLNKMKNNIKVWPLRGVWRSFDGWKQ